MKTLLLWVTMALAPMHAGWAADGGPARVAEKGCVWEKLVGADTGFEAWVQRCDFGFRRVELFIQGHRVMERYSDAPANPEPLIEIIDLPTGSGIETGIKRIFAERTKNKTQVKHCVLARVREQSIPAGVRRFTFMPDAAYAKTLAAHAKKDEVPDPPCGGWGIAPDGNQYFEAQPGRAADKVMFVNAGQDAPLFDEQTLRLTGRSPAR